MPSNKTEDSQDTKNILHLPRSLVSLLTQSQLLQFVYNNEVTLLKYVSLGMFWNTESSELKIVIIIYGASTKLCPWPLKLLLKLMFSFTKNTVIREGTRESKFWDRKIYSNKVHFKSRRLRSWFFFLKGSFSTSQFINQHFSY